MSSQYRFRRRARALALFLMVTVAPPALAQTVTAGGVLPAGAPQSTNADLLSRYLRELAQDPENLSALRGAGDAALQVGDADAAFAFYARAEKVAPRDGQVKAGIARALLKSENPRDALRMFDEATSLGVREAEIAGDRGLAHDLRGEARKAQKDYALALAARPDDEITRRYALSLAISGDREPALKLLEPQIYRRDPAGWRARAFVLALTGDSAEAGKIVHAMMPGPMADAMQPFLVRLGGLKPTEKALAVHLGRFPSDGTRYASMAGQPEPRPVPAPSRSALQVAEADDGDEATTAKPAPAPSRPVRRTEAARALADANQDSLVASQAVAEQAKVTAARTAQTQTPVPPTRGGTQAPVRMTAEARRGVLAEIMRNLKVPDAELATSIAEDAPTPAVTRSRTRPTAVPIVTPTKGKALAAADDMVAPAKGRKGKAAAPVADDDPAPVTSKGRKGKPVAAAEADDDKPNGRAKGKAAAKKAAEKTPPKAPSRIWVQVAGGANKNDLGKSWSQVKGQAGAALKGRSAYTTPLRATHRLLTGPFKTMDEAQAFVNKLRKSGVSAFAFTSNAGQAVDKIDAK